jgi:hypothetical protein
VTASPQEGSDREGRDEPSTPKLDAQGRRGRVLFFAGLSLYLVWELTVVVLQSVFSSPLLVQSAVRTLSGLVLFFFAWRGRTWAAVLLTVAFTIFFLAGWLTFASGGYGSEVGVLIAAAGSIFGAFGAALHLLPSLRAYRAHQRTWD